MDSALTLILTLSTTFLESTTRLQETELRARDHTTPTCGSKATTIHLEPWLSTLLKSTSANLSIRVATSVATSDPLPLSQTMLGRRLRRRSSPFLTPSRECSSSTLIKLLLRVQLTPTRPKSVMQDGSLRTISMTVMSFIFLIQARLTIPPGFCQKKTQFIGNLSLVLLTKKYNLQLMVITG